jgi:hypothetical protein
MVNRVPHLYHDRLVCDIHHHTRHADGLYTPQDEHSRLQRAILPVAGRRATHMGRERACRHGPLGPKHSPHVMAMR